MKDKVDNSINSPSVVCLSKELTAKLETCYYGFRDALQEQVKDFQRAGVSRDQAIFNVIVQPRIKVYYRDGLNELNGVVKPKKKAKK